MKATHLTLPQVQTLAQTLAKKIKPNGLKIGLVGNLGSGKTTFAKAFAKTLGIKNLKSPTFIVSQRYSWHKNFLYHLDFYRLMKASELEPLGLNEILASPALVLIEWVDKFPAVKKLCDIVITFKVKDHNSRDVTIKFN